jgi:hypothetical protein
VKAALGFLLCAVLFMLVAVIVVGHQLSAQETARLAALVPATTPGVIEPPDAPAWVTAPAGYITTITPPKKTDFILTVVGNDTKELAAIRGDGRLYLNGKEVHTDREYRKAMMALMKGMAGCPQ